MKKFGVFVLALLLSSALISGCTPKTETKTAKTADWDTVEAAYHYCYPLVLVNASKEKITNTAAPTDSQAPINQLFHSKGLATAASKDVVTPNTDTLYSQAFLDLTDNPMVFVKPAADRFVAIQLLDAYTNTVTVLGTGGDTQNARTYLITGPDFNGTVPENMIQVAMPTNMSWIFARILCKGEDDLTNVYAIQNQFQLLPLSAYTSGAAYTPPVGTVNPDYDFVPVDQVMKMTPQEFFDTANQLMAENPPSAADAPILETLSTINVGPNKTFDASVLGNQGEENWKNMVANLETDLYDQCQPFYVNLGQWFYLGEPIAKFGTEYAYRALVALGGLNANPVSVAIYPRVGKDNNGETLNGNNSYTIHFDKDGLPPTNEYGFWSITAYGNDNFLIDNPLNRYCINDRSSLKFNEDGSLDLLLQANAPEDQTMMNNWLPVSTNDFHLYMRIYLPKDAVLSGQWTAPSIAKTAR
jgi:hypothetical protein